MKETFKVLHIMALRLSTYKRSMILSRSKELQQTTVKTNGWVPMMTCMNVQTPNRLAIVTIMYNSRFVTFASIKYNDSLCTRWMASFNENDGEYRPFFVYFYCICIGICICHCTNAVDKAFLCMNENDEWDQWVLAWVFIHICICICNCFCWCIEHCE